ncbi:MAG: hypothetical protein OK449_03300 [Thaumarchaeota archaeon]|nr:hypothetical protein [Nitrososphaerota archaeon]
MNSPGRTQIQGYMDHLGPSAGVATWDSRTPKTNMVIVIGEVWTDFSRLVSSGISLPTGVEIGAFQRFVPINLAAKPLGPAPLTFSELEDVTESRRERARGESKRFSTVGELFADLDS